MSQTNLIALLLKAVYIVLISRIKNETIVLETVSLKVIQFTVKLGYNEQI